MTALFDHANSAPSMVPSSVVFTDPVAEPKHDALEGASVIVKARTEHDASPLKFAPIPPLDPSLRRHPLVPLSRTTPPVMLASITSCDFEPHQLHVAVGAYPDRPLIKTLFDPACGCRILLVNDCVPNDPLEIEMPANVLPDAPEPVISLLMIVAETLPTVTRSRIPIPF